MWCDAGIFTEFMEQGASHDAGRQDLCRGLLDLKADIAHTLSPRFLARSALTTDRRNLKAMAIAADA